MLRARASKIVFTHPGSCVDGSLLARFVLRFVQAGRVQSCVRPVDAVLMTAGPNAIRRMGTEMEGIAFLVYEPFFANSVQIRRMGHDFVKSSNDSFFPLAWRV